ncbi:hypothetical protein [Amycolatopsis sp. NPDC059657]|uniref:hypothetical protein n=1 Tax=Amycolatopsis sp. NPDC059657 TaxID=3346899 RepID=UPI00366F430D
MRDALTPVLHRDKRWRSTTVKICAAMFWTNTVSLAGVLAISLWLLATTNSYLLSSALFGCQWLLPMLIPKGIAWLIRDRSPRAVAVVSELATVAIYLLLTLCVATGFVPGVFFFVILRGYTSALTRAAASLAIKLDGAGSSAVEEGIGRIELWGLIGNSASGILFAVAGATTSAPAMLFVGAAAYLVSAGIYATLTLPARTPSGDEPRRAANPTRIRDAVRAEPMAAMLLAQLTIITLFQGVHNAVRVAYPDQVLHEGADGIGVVSTVGTAALLCGSWLVTREAVRARLGSTLPWVFVVVTGLLAALAVSITVPASSYAVYFLFFMTFEAGFVHFNRKFVAAVDLDNASVLLGLRAAVLCGAVVAGIGLTSLALAVTTVGWSVYLVSAVAICLSLAVYRRYRRLPA